MAQAQALAQGQEQLAQLEERENAIRQIEVQWHLGYSNTFGTNSIYSSILIVCYSVIPVD